MAGDPIPTKSQNNLTAQTEQVRRLNMKENAVPGSRPRPRLGSFTFTMPTNSEDHSVVSGITMSSNLMEERDLSMDEVFDFPIDDKAAANDQHLDHASQATPQAPCLPFERTLDTVFFKIYDAFLDEEAMMFVCQDDPSEGTPILDYVADDIPAVISTTPIEDISPEDRGASSSMLSKNLKTYRSSSLSVDGYPASITKQEEGTPQEPTTGTPQLSSRELDAAVVSTETEAEDDDSPWRLNSLLYSSPVVPMSKDWAHWKDESIEVNDTGCVIFDDTFETVVFEADTSDPPVLSEEITTKPPASERDQPPVEEATILPSTPSFDNSDDSFRSQATDPATNQTLFDAVETSSPVEPSSKKRKLGLRYLFSPKLRRLMSWRRQSPKKYKYQNMKKLDDPSYSPETVTTFAHTSRSESFECDMSLKTKTSSVMSTLKQDPAFPHSPQSHYGSRSMEETGSLSYAYPQSMLA